MKKKWTTPATPQLTGEIYPSEKGLDAAAKKIQQLAPFAAKGPQTAAQINRPQVGQLEPSQVVAGPAPKLHEFADRTVLNLPAVDLLTRAVQELRQVRDAQTYLRVGCRSFREFCVQRFGERLGGMVEDGL